jgi:hypothetical protein
VAARKMSLRRIISRGQIRRRVKELAAQIRADYSGQRVVFVCVLKGAFIFLADLVRQVGPPLEVDFMAASSYGMEKSSKGQITILKDVTAHIAGRPVILVDDIIDSGLTASTLPAVARPACGCAPCWPASGCWRRARSSSTWAFPCPRVSWWATASTMPSSIANCRTST